MSILNSLKGLLSNELVSSAAAHLGESQDGVQKAMGGIFPTLFRTNTITYFAGKRNVV